MENLEPVDLSTGVTFRGYPISLGSNGPADAPTRETAKLFVKYLEKHIPSFGNLRARPQSAEIEVMGAF